jgi:hypothetical protein
MPSIWEPKKIILQALLPGIIFVVLVLVAWFALGLKTDELEADSAPKTQWPVLQTPGPSNSAKPEGLTSDPFRAAAAKRTTDTPQQLSGTTNCVALVSAFSTASSQCKDKENSKTCESNYLKEKGFDPEHYGFCKLYQAPASTSPFG